MRHLRSGGIAVQLQILNLLESACKGSPVTSRAAASAGAIPVLVRLLRSSSPRIQAVSAGAIYAMMQSAAELRSAIVAAGAVAPLVALLQSSHDGVKIAAACALDMLCIQSTEGTQEAAAAGGVPAAVQLLCSGREQARIPALCLLASFLRQHSNEVCPAIEAAPRAVPRLVRLLDPARQRGKDVQACAASILAVAHGSRQLALACIKAGALPRLAELTRAPDEDLHRKSMAALRSLASKCPAEVAAGSGIVPALVRVAGSSVDAGTLKYAALSFRYLAIGSPQGTQAITEAGGADALLQRQKHTDSGVREHAATAWAQLYVAAELQGAEEVLAAVEAAVGSAERVRSQPRVCAAEGCVATKGLKLCARCGTVRYCRWAHGLFLEDVCLLVHVRVGGCGSGLQGQADGLPPFSRVHDAFQP